MGKKLLVHCMDCLLVSVYLSVLHSNAECGLGKYYSILFVDQHQGILQYSAGRHCSKNPAAMWQRFLKLPSFH